MSKHTPGPWTLGEGDPEHILSTVSSYCVAEANKALPNMDANARLIASAPELLEALEFVIDRFESGKDGFVFSQRLALTKARNAIAKATGDAQ